MKKKLVITMLVLAVLTLAIVMADPDPLGATLTPGQSSRGTDTDASSNPQNAQAGNVTQLNINQSRITQIWQGYYGNVSGQIVLENSGGDTFYDWSLAAITGEVYASRNLVPDWSTINCTNSTHWEAEESELNIVSADTDGINETYDTATHPTFQVGTKTIPTDYCQATRPYNSAGAAGAWYNVLMNSNSTNTVYVVVLAEDQSAFDGSTADFELLVPTDKSSGLATYYFYVELA